MRELSKKERDFLKSNVSEETELDGASGRPLETKAQRSSWNPLDKLSHLSKNFLNYLPLVIAGLTLFLAGLAMYLYFWAKSFFKIEEIQSVRSEESYAELEPELQRWLDEISGVFELAPWLILALLLLGVGLMGLSIFLIRRKNG